MPLGISGGMLLGLLLGVKMRLGLGLRGMNRDLIRGEEGFGVVM